ncbi:hypothetical protein C8Q76DRAFT_791977 [Earliella scabrosa]|nr:hypothetical protein C8Q76DRAFT_791977 [Earliella scabrosa]
MSSSRPPLQYIPQPIPARSPSSPPPLLRHTTHHDRLPRAPFHQKTLPPSDSSRNHKSTMTVMTVTVPAPSPFNPITSRPRVSSPLAASAQPRPAPGRTHSFPTSRPLRPFPSLSIAPASSARKPVKIIEPPANFKGAFVLNLTQAELSRQD